VGLDVGEGQWSLYWTARRQPVPCRLVPVLAGWADLDGRETAADIQPRQPILVDPRKIALSARGNLLAAISMALSMSGVL
jgi:hypothetical protein